MRKLKNKACLVLILLVGCIVSAIGAIWAKYQTNIPGEVIYEAREQATIRLWSVDGTGELVDSSAQWELIGGEKTLTFAVGNYEMSENGETLCSESTQGVKIKLLASLGLNYNEKVVVQLKMPSEKDGAEEIFIATATAIAEDSPYYHSFGPGWVFEFEDEFGEDPYWLLQGGEASYVVGQVSISGADVNQAALVQLIAESDMSKH